MRKDLLGLLDGEEMEMYVLNLTYLLDANEEVIKEQDKIIEAQNKLLKTKLLAEHGRCNLRAFIDTKRVKYNDQLYPKDKEVMDLDKEE